MPTNPKDNKGGDLAEIKDLVNRKVPKPTVTQRRNRWTKESNTQALARQAREDVDKVRTVNHSRSKFAERQIDVLRGRSNAWAAQEKADIQSGAKKVPLTSKEKIMAENKKNPFPVKTEHYAKNPAMKQIIRSEAAASRIDTTIGTASSSRPGKDLGEKYPGTTGQTIENARNLAKGYRAGKAIAEGRIGDPNEYSDLSVPKSFKPNMPAAAQSRMKADKPLKTGLVRETETRTSRAEAADTHRLVRARQQTGELSKKFSESQQSTRDFMRMQSAAETGEAQEFVGKMKPGVAARTEAHSFQSKSNLHERLSEVSKQHMSENPDKYPRKPLWNQGARDTFDAAKGIAKNPANDAVDLGEKTPGATKLSAKFRRESVELAREINPAWNKAHAPVGEAALKNPAGLAQRTEAHRLQSREFNYPPANQSKDLGRAVTNTIRREQAPGLSRERLQGSEIPPKGGSLMKLAKERAAQGRSIAGPDAAKPMSLSQRLKAGKLKLGGFGGKLGAYGAVKGALEGASTLRKLKSGAYDLTPEGTATPKKGVVES